MNWTKLACALAVSIGLSGCASIVNDSSYPVAIQSAPDGAHFEVRNQLGVVVQTGSTPSTVMLPSSAGYFDGEKYTIKYSKPGFGDQTVTLDSSVSGWYWGNLLIGGVIGMLVVDPLTGDMYRLPESASGSLSESPESPEVTSKAGGRNDLTLITLDQVPKSKRGELIRL